MLRYIRVHTHTHTHTQTHTHTHTHKHTQFTDKKFPFAQKKTPLRYAYIYIPGDINRGEDVSVYGLKAYGEVVIEIHAFLISTGHANNWRASSLRRFAAGSH